jgi:hypothetical protein
MVLSLLLAGGMAGVTAAQISARLDPGAEPFRDFCRLESQREVWGVKSRGGSGCGVPRCAGTRNRRKTLDHF